LRLAARKVKGRHWIPVIRQTEATPHRIGHASGAQIMYNKAQGPAEIGVTNRMVTCVLRGWK
jgi:hypothetical protein